MDDFFGESSLNRKEEDACQLYVKCPDDEFFLAMKRAGYAEKALRSWEEKFLEPKIQNRIQQLRDDSLPTSKESSPVELRKQILIEVSASITALALLRDTAKSEKVKLDAAQAILDRAGFSTVKLTMKKTFVSTVDKLNEEVQRRMEMIESRGANSK